MKSKKPRYMANANRDLIPGRDDNAIWAQLTADIQAIRYTNPDVKKELLAFVEYEKQKVSKYKMPSAPFIIRANTTYDDPLKGPVGPGYNKLPYAPYEQFRSEIARLKKKTFTDNAAEIEESMMKLQKIFSLRKVTIHGKDLQLKDFPDDANHGLPGKDLLDVPTIIKKKYALGKKYLEIHWDALEGKMFAVRIECVDVRERDIDGETRRTNLYTKLVDQELQNNYFQFDVTNPKCTIQKLNAFRDKPSHTYRVKVTVKKTDSKITDKQWRYIKGQIVHIPDQDVTIQKYRMNPSNSLFPIDKFRLEICHKYKTLYDLFRLVPTVTNDMSFVAAYRNIVGNYNVIIGDPDTPEPFQKWEYLRIPNDWKTLSYWEQVLVIVFKGKPMMSPKTLALQLTTLFDCDIINTNITNLGISHNMDKPYAVDPAKGGSQRMTGAKRPYYALTTIPTQLDSAFVNRGNQYKAVQTTNIIYDSTWKQSKKYFKKNSVVYGREYHDFIYLDTRLEREACDTLRRIDRLLRLSHERGYPVLNKSVAAPYNYANNTSFARDTMFGVNNYDRTQSYPPLQAAPLIMAGRNVGDNAKARIEDPQKTFDRRGMTKAAKMIDVVKVNTGNDDIYYNHPMYPSKQKKDAWGRL